MIKNLTLLLLGILVSTASLSAQGGMSCNDSEETALCDLDDINGYTFTNPPPGGSVPSESLCNGGAFHNPGWFSFVAGSSEIELAVVPVPGTCDTVANGNFGVQVALWSGCPDFGGECVAGDAACSDQPINLMATNLVIGDIYNLVIDGCSGSVCTVEVFISTAEAFQLPPLVDAEFQDPEYNSGRGGSCENSLGDGNFCAGLEVLFQLDDGFYESLGAEWVWTFEGPGVNDIEWSFGSFSGTGSPAVIGDLDGELGANGINAIFGQNGTYTVCLDNVIAECDSDAEGPICTEVNIITPGDQMFDTYDVCAIDLLLGWDPGDADAVDENGNPWIAGLVTYDMVEDGDGTVEIQTVDDCGCDFTQIININIQGTVEREEVELFIWECMLPYEWFEEEFPDLESLPEGADYVVESSQSDWEDETCDSLISLTITPLTMLDTVIVGDCTSDGTEFTFEITALDPNGNQIDIMAPNFEWVDVNTGMVVSNTQSAFLETGTYSINLQSFIQDLNYMDDELAGIEEEHPCNFQFGPYDLVGGSSVDPDVNPYDQVYCEDELNLLTFSIDTLPDTDYTWIIPPSYNTLFQAEDSLAVSIDVYVPTDTLFVAAANSCGSSDSIPLPIMVVAGPDVLTDGAAMLCDGEEYFTAYDGDPALISLFEWDVPDGTITTGDINAQGIGVTFDMPGDYEYTLTVTDLDGCTSSETFEVSLEENLAAVVVECGGDPSQIIFSWQDVAGATGYDVVEVEIPTGATGTLIGTTYVITGINGGDEVTINVTATGNTSCIESGQDVTCQAPGCDFSGISNNNFTDYEYCVGEPGNDVPTQFDIVLSAGYSGSYSGNGVTADGMFDPLSPDLVLGDNVLSFNYEDATGCSGSFSATITINEIPDPSFTPSATEFCVGEVIELMGASADGIYDYGSGSEGDFSALSYRTSGAKTVMVSLTDPMTGCGENYEVMLNVLDTVPAPLISCVPGTSEVEFDWDDHPLADEFEVTVVVNGGPPQVFTQSNSDFMQTGLVEGDQVDITVSVTASNGCNTTTSSESCEAKACLVPDIQLNSAVTEFCGNDVLNPVQIDVTVDGAAPSAGTFQWIGSGVDDSGIFDPSQVNVGVTRITFRYTNPVDNCVTSGSIDFTLLEVPVPSYNLSNNVICVDDVLTLTMEATPANVTRRIETDGGLDNPISADELEIGWDAPGVYTISVAYTLGSCPEELVPAQITVQDTVRTPVIACADVETDLIQFGWQDQSAVSDYEVYIDGDLVSTQANSDYLLTGLDPEQLVEIRVIALDPVCGDKESTQLCRSQACVPPVWTTNVPAEFCYEAGSGPITLDVSAESGSGQTGIVSWVSSEVDADNNFTPGNTSQDYSLTVNYTERNCSFDTTFNIRVNIIPSAQLELTSSDVICVGSSVSVQSNYTAAGGEMPMWDFDGATSSGSDFGPYDVTFDTPGTYTIGLSVDNNGCIGPQESVIITVEEELLAPEVVCTSSDINEVNISWDAVDCAGEYAVFVDGTEVDRITDTQYSVTGLVENQEIEVVVEAISECACDNISSQVFTCSSKACIAPTWNINVVDQLCWEPSLGSIKLDVSADSNDPSQTGTLTWTTPFVDANNNFTPANNSQDYILTVEYTEGECTFQNTVEIKVDIIPEAQLELTSESVICEGSTVQLISNYAPTGAEVANWDFDGGVPAGSGFGPYDVRFDTPGNYTISLFVDNNGCQGDVETVNIEVQEELVSPVLDCVSDDINSIDLSWALVECAQEYTIFVNGVFDGTTSNTSYTITGLNENQQVDVFIEAVSECACDNVMSQTISCSSKPCDPTTWSFSSNTLDQVCLDSTAEPFTITATPNDLSGNGTGSWSGAAIADPSGAVDPSLVGPGSYEFVYTYSEGGCDYTAPVVEITFVDEPDLTLEAMDPACPMEETGTITATGMGGASGYSYSLDGGVFQASGEFMDVSIGTHTVEIIDGNGCINEAQINLFAPLTPQVTISGPSTVISENDASYTVNIQDADNIEDIIWTSGGQIVCQGINCTEFTAVNAISDFELSVEVIYNGGCMAFSESFLVDVKEIQAYYIPNIVAFSGTPGVNSRWTMYIKGNETFPRSIKVYTRWGELIYDNNFNITTPEAEVELWDGFSGDNQLESGVYVYAMEIEIEGRSEFIVGDITILR